MNRAAYEPFILTEDDLDTLSYKIDCNVDTPSEIHAAAGAMWELRYGRKLPDCTCGRYSDTDVIHLRRCFKCRASRYAARTFDLRWFQG